MPESFPSSIAATILRKIVFLSSPETGLSSKVRTETKKVQKMLLDVKDVLLDAEARESQMQDRLEKLSESLSDAEDLLDELEGEVLAKQVGKLNTIKYSLKVKLTRKRLDEMLDTIKSITSDDKDKPMAKIVHSGENLMNHPFAGTPQVFGRDNDKKEIIKFLYQENSEGENVSIISIVGIGGFGKTTLAKLVYDDKMVDEHFDLKMWVNVPDDFDMIRLMKEAYTSATGKNHAELGVVELEDRLLKELVGKKFLLVLDDVWNENYDRWDRLKKLFTEEANGSKIVVTTRSNQVASMMGTVDNYNLKCLSEDDCMLLFEKSAFGDETDQADLKLIEIGKQIVSKCGGVPLVVKTLGTLLYKNTNADDWSLIRESVNWEQDQDRDNILSALKLSYDHLPSHLRRCLAYCSLFPRGSCFNSDYLICNWMAHDFLSTPMENEELEDVGLRYLKALVSRCFFQDVEDHGYYFTFKMHNLIYDFVEKMAQRDCKTVDLRILHQDINSGHLSFLGNARHLSFLGIGNGNKKFPSISNNLRTIIIQSLQSESVSESFVKGISNFKFLRLLCLSGLLFKELPDSLGGLRHLRFLDLSLNSELENLYKTISKLLSLQTLKLLGCSALMNFPPNTEKMSSLRYLELTIQGDRLQKIATECSQLQYLHLYKCKKLVSLREWMEGLTSIRTLILQGCDSLESLSDVQDLKKLEKLVIHSCPELNLAMDLQDKDLRLNLKVLMIYELQELTELPAWVASLTALQKLEIVSCSRLSSLPAGMEKLTALQKLEIVSCSELSSLPAGMEKLTALRELKIQKSPRLSECCRKRRLNIPNLEIHLDPEAASSSRE